MRFQSLLPPGDPAPPEQFYTGLELEARAPADRPYVVVNFVSSADGKATADGRTAQLGGDGDRAMFHLLRTQVDAILAGTGTLRIERYGDLIRDRRQIEIRVAEGRAAEPLAVVVSRSGDVPFEIPLFDDPEARVALYAPATTVIPDRAAQVQLHPVPGGEAPLSAMLRALRAEHGVRSLLCEGGPTLFDALLEEDVVDELFLTLSPDLVGGGEHALTSGGRLTGGPRPLRLLRALERDGHLFLRYARR